MRTSAMNTIHGMSIRVCIRFHVSSLSTCLMPVVAGFLEAHVVFDLFLGLKKKLVTISNKKDNRELRPWVRSITNHLYWACSSSHGDGQVTIYGTLKKKKKNNVWSNNAHCKVRTKILLIVFLNTVLSKAYSSTARVGNLSHFRGHLKFI